MVPPRCAWCSFFVARSDLLRLQVSYMGFLPAASFRGSERALCSDIARGPRRKPMAGQAKLFESHVAWVASLRAQYAMQAANPPIFLPELFNDAIDFESPV